jgi:hypothetical protein
MLIPRCYQDMSFLEIVTSAGLPKITTSGASFLASGVNLAPQFTTNETFLFHVPDANTDFLIEIVDRGTRETRYIRIK